MGKRDLGVTLLILVLLVTLGAAVEYNYQRNRAAEERSSARSYRGYSDAQIASLIAAYEEEVEALDSRYDDARSRSLETRSGGHIDQRIKDFERAQKAGGSTRSMGAVVAQKESVLRELRREQSLRGPATNGLMLHLRRLVTF